MTKTLQQQIVAILKCGWAYPWQVQAALRPGRYISESTTSRQIRLARSMGANVQMRRGKGAAFEYRVARGSR